MAYTAMNTEELLVSLQSRGWSITAERLRKDVQDGYLPPSTIETRGGRHNGRYWEVWEVERAVYLYRLRNKGLSGQLLKVFLFLRDGWGWEDVKPICIEGLQKLILIESGPVRRHLRRHNRKAGSVKSVIVNEISEEASDGGYRTLPHTSTSLFTWGLGLFGKPLEGGSLLPVSHACNKILFGSEHNETINEESKIATQLLANLNLTWENILSIVQESSEEQAGIGAFYHRYIFKTIHSLLKSSTLRDTGKYANVSLFTLAGRTQQELTIGLRELPQRITPAQLFAATIAPFILVTDLKVLFELYGNILLLVMNSASANHEDNSSV